MKTEYRNLVNKLTPMKIVEVMILCPEEKIKVPKRLKNAFKDYAIEEWCQQVEGDDRKFARKALHDIMEVHHIIPRFLGGENRENLALVEPLYHVSIHYNINKQLFNIRDKEIRKVSIPIQQGLVWGVDSSAVERWTHISIKQRDLLKSVIYYNSKQNRPKL